MNHSDLSEWNTTAHVPYRFVWQTLTHHRARLIVALSGVGFSVFLMVFQGSLLIGFIVAAQRVIRSAGVDIWLIPRGVRCFDFSARLPQRLGEITRGIEGVTDTRRIVAGFTTWQRTDGESRPVLLVGSDARGFEQALLPVPVRTDESSLDVDGVVVDSSNTSLLQVPGIPTFVEIAGHRANVVGIVHDFNSFLGSPYVFTSHEAAGLMLGYGLEETSYIGVRVKGTSDPHAVAMDLSQRFPDLDVLTTSSFASRSSTFWLLQTGAGGAILTAALLGFIVGLVIVSQTLYASTLEHIREYAVLKAMGASNAVVCRIVLLQAFALGMAGGIAGLIAVDPLAHLARIYVVPWVITPGWLRVLALAGGLAMCSAGALGSVRIVTRVDPGIIFRG
jgi:putative ABC transport system permease protein